MPVPILIIMDHLDQTQTIRLYSDFTSIQPFPTIFMSHLLCNFACDRTAIVHPHEEVQVRGAEIVSAE